MNLFENKSNSKDLHNNVHYTSDFKLIIISCEVGIKWDWAKLSNSPRIIYFRIQNSNHVISSSKLILHLTTKNNIHFPRDPLINYSMLCTHFIFWNEFWVLILLSFKLYRERMELDIVSEIHTWGRKLSPETSAMFPCGRQITEWETLLFFWSSDLSQSSTRINFKKPSVFQTFSNGLCRVL